MTAASSYKHNVRYIGGDETKPAILFIPGFAEDSTMFVPLAETALASRYRLVAPDLPGFGSAPPLEGPTTLQALAGVVYALVEREQVQVVVAHSLGSIIASLAARHSPRLISTIISLEGNLTADDAYFSGMAADFGDAVAFQRAFLERLDEMAKEKPIVARYRSVVGKANSRAMWELGCDARRFSRTCVPGDVLTETGKVCYLYNPENCLRASLDWLQSHRIQQIRMDGATHWASVDQPNLVAKSILHALGRVGHESDASTLANS